MPSRAWLDGIRRLMRTRELAESTPAVKRSVRPAAWKLTRTVPEARLVIGARTSSRRDELTTRARATSSLAANGGGSGVATVRVSVASPQAPLRGRLFASPSYVAIQR